MRVSLQIDGDASGAVKAAADTTAAIGDLGKQADGISKAIEDGFKMASGAAGDLKGASQAVGAANDNAANSALGLASKLSQMAGAASGADSALAKGAAGAVNFAKGLGDVAKSVGVFNVVGGIIGLAATAASTFYGVVNAGSTESSKHLDDTTAHITAANNAYRAATVAAGAYYEKANAIAILESTQNLKRLRADENNNSAKLANSLTPSQIGQFTGAFIGEPGMENGVAGTLFPDQGNERFKAFQAQFDALNASIRAGKAEWEQFGKAVAAAGAEDPAKADAAEEILKRADARIKGAAAISEEERNLRLYTNTATKADLAARGITTSTTDNVGAFNRLADSMDRQSKSQLAEAQTAGQSAGAAAQLRSQFILNEAAQQSGIAVAGAYAAKIKAIADRAGEAAQKLALAKLQSDASFNLDQLGRSTTDAAVADQLRGAFGNNADQNSAIANAIRFNETMKDIKATTLDLASGAFRDFRSEIQAGTGAFQALEKAGLNALSKISDKLLDKSLDAGISKLFGSFLGFGGGINANGSIAVAIGPTSVGGAPLVFDAGGYTGAGAKHDVAGFVHKDEYVFNKERTNQLGVGFLDRLHRGYADGGLVGGPAPWGSATAAPSAGNTGSGRPLGVHLTADVVVSVDDKGELKAHVRQVAAETVGDYVGSPGFIGDVATASNAAKSYRLMK